MGALTATRAAWAWGQQYLPEDRGSRYLTLAILGSLLAHALLGMSVLFTGWLSSPVIAHRGDALFADTSSDQDEKAAPAPPAPVRPPAPERPVDEGPRPAPRALTRAQPPAPEPRAAPAAPRVADVTPSRPPDPPREMAKAVPPPPAGEEPAYEGRSAQSSSAVPAPRTSAETAPPPAAPAPAGEPRVASVPRPPPSSGGGAAPSQPRGGGGGIFQGSQGGVVGQPVPLDTPDPNYRDYMARVRQQIYAKWVYPREAQDRELRGRLVVEFQIGKDGRLLTLDLITSSGEYVLDSSALNAVKHAERYTPLPDAMQRDVLPVAAIFK